MALPRTIPQDARRCSELRQRVAFCRSRLRQSRTQREAATSIQSGTRLKAEAIDTEVMALKLLSETQEDKERRE